MTSSMQSTNKNISGTAPFMAPELIMNSKYGVGSDIWALGCTIIEAVSGKAPWIDDFKDCSENTIALLVNIGSCKRAPTYPETVSPGLVDFLNQCFHIDPAKRWTASQLLAHPYFNEDLAMPIMEKNPVADSMNDDCADTEDVSNRDYQESFSQEYT